MPRLIDADKLLEWLKGRGVEAANNAFKTSSSTFKGKVDAFKDVADYVVAGTFDLTPLDDELTEEDKKDLAEISSMVKVLQRNTEVMSTRLDELNESLDRIKGGESNAV